MFSGIEAASHALESIGFEPVAFAEIEPFPCAVLEHYFPNVPNLGDVTKITESDIAKLGHIDIVVFGSPCQDLSIAGARRGFIDVSGNHTRSGLFFTAMRIVGWARKHCATRFAIWENVPGAYSSNKGRDFAEVVSHMAGLSDVAVPKHGWGTEGCEVGDHGMLEWACLDAQWFGVAQRRRRVFAVVDFGDWANRPPILLERQSLRGDSPPRRKASEDVAGTLDAGIGRRRGSGMNANQLVQARSVALRGREVGGAIELGDDVGFTLRASGGGGEKPHVLCFGGNNTSGPIDVAPCLNAHGGTGRLDFESERFAVSTKLHNTTSNGAGKFYEEYTPALDACSPPFAVFHSTGASYWQEGVGTLRARPQDSHENVVCVTGDVTHTLKAEGFDASEDGTGRGQPIIAFSCKDYGNDAGEVAPTLRSMNHSGSHQNGGGQVAIQTAMQVRRLLPVECERLQGFKPGYTDIPYRGKVAADGNRYKSIGNSMAVPVMRWIGKQIKAAVNG